LRVQAVLPGENLYGNNLTCLFVPGAINRAHSSGSDFFQQLVMSDAIRLNRNVTHHVRFGLKHVGVATHLDQSAGYQLVAFLLLGTDVSNLNFVETLLNFQQKLAFSHN
jgi:hypothetical protein